MPSVTPIAQCRVLVTGFEPFGDHEHNTSAWLAQSLQHDAIRGCVSAVLPTAYAAAAAQIRTLLSELRPRYALHLGLAANRQNLSFETRASNRDRSPAKDNHDEVRNDLVIEPSAPESYPSELPFAELEQLATSLGEPLELSNEAGGFVCNHVFFQSTHWSRSTLSADRATRTGFIHVPDASLDPQRAAKLQAVVHAWARYMAAL